MSRKREIAKLIRKNRNLPYGMFIKLVEKELEEYANQRIGEMLEYVSYWRGA